MPEKTFLWQATENAKNVDEDQKYRLRQFYRLLLQADKDRITVLAAVRNSSDNIVQRS